MPSYRPGRHVSASGPIRLLLALALVFAISTPLQGQVPRGVSGDLVADKVFGKPDFTQVTPYTTVAGKLFLPHGVIVDRSDPAHNKLYVYDSGNNRILGLDLNACRASRTDPLGCIPAIVIGQPTMNSSACNGDSGFQSYPARPPASASSLCAESEAQLSINEGGSGASMAVDADGNLYVADYWNHRVLKYPTPFQNGGVASDVWGQQDYTSNLCNKGLVPNATSLCFSWGLSNNWTAGIDFDAAGNLWVADSGNHRVLRFAPGSKMADLVLGQPDFETSIPGYGLNQFFDPSVVRVSPATGWVYVAESTNNRVLVFKPPFLNGMAGQVFGSHFGRPQGLDFDPTEPGSVWIANLLHATVELWSEGGTKIRELGTRDISVIGGGSGSVGIDSLGNVYVAVTGGPYGSDVLAFDKGAPPDLPTRQLFGATPGGNEPDASGLGWSVEGVAVADGQLIVSDNDRLLFWNDPRSAVSGQPADGYAAGAAGFADFQFDCCGVAVADRNHHLFVAGAVSSAGIVHVYQLPLTLGAVPVLDLAPPFPMLGGGVLDGDNTYTGVAVSETGDLWLSQSRSNRVFRLRDPLTHPMVDVVLGQLSASETACNRGSDPAPNTLCQPGHVSIDRRGNLFVSDHSLEINGNLRLLEFNRELTPSANTDVIYAPAATKTFPQSPTWQPAFDSANHMIVGYNPYGSRYKLSNGWFPGMYSDPLAVQGTLPNKNLQDYCSMAYAAVFDEEDNLYIADLDRSRILFYEKPTASLPAITHFWPSSGPPGTSVILTGRNLSGTIGVSFQGFRASFHVDSDTQITATVPALAKTGAISLTSTSTGGARAVADFVVTAQRQFVELPPPPRTPKRVGPR